MGNHQEVTADEKTARGSYTALLCHSRMLLAGIQRPFQPGSPTVNLDARQKRSDMTFEQSVIIGLCGLIGLIGPREGNDDAH